MRCAPKLAMTVDVGKPTCSQSFAYLESSLVSDVWLGMRSWESSSSSEMLLGLSVLGGSQEESV